MAQRVGRTCLTPSTTRRPSAENARVRRCPYDISNTPRKDIHVIVFSPRRLLAVGLLALGLLVSYGLLNYASSARADASTLNLETLTGAEAEEMLKDGQLTSVELVKAYLARIEALNKSGPGINAVTQINPDALKEAKKADQ